MPIGTSNGEHYEDEFDQAHTEMFGAGGTYDKKTDTFVADTEPTPKEIYFVRHGDTPLNKEGEKSDDRAPVRGWNDTSLNDQGRSDAEKAAEKLSKEPITHIVTSDLPRASETASIIGDKLGITPEEHPGLRTWNLGEYTGKTGKDVHAAVDNLCLHAPDTRPNGGESFNEFKDRILTTFGEIAKDHAEHEVLVVSHNSPERILNAWDKAGQPESREIDRKSYHADDGAINPGEHKTFMINNVDALNRPSKSETGMGATSYGMENETGWMKLPNFEERWQGDETTSEMFDKLERMMKYQGSNSIGNIQWLLRNKNKAPEGWTANQFPQSPPSLQKFNWEKYPGPGAGPKGRGPSLGWQGQQVFPNTPGPEGSGETIIMPYDPESVQQFYNYRIADVENSIEDLATKHGVEGSKMRDIITDIAKHPMDYISPMPGEMGMAAPKGVNPGAEVLRKLIKEGKTLGEIADQYGVKAPSVSYWLKKFDITANPSGSPKMATTKELFERLDKGETQASIAESLGTSKAALNNRLRNEGMTKLSAEEWRDLREFYKNFSEGGPTEPEMIDSMKKYLTDKNVPKMRRAANQNTKEDTIEHPLMNLLENWVNPRQDPYAKAAAKQKSKITSTKQWVGADRNKYPNTYMTPDKNVQVNLSTIDRMLEVSKKEWDAAGLDPDLFELEYAQTFKRKREFEDRMNNMK